SGADTATQTFKQADPSVRPQGESVSVTLSSVDKVKIAPPTVGTPSIFAASPNTPINANRDVPRATASPLEQRTDQSSPRQLGGGSNGGSSIGSLGSSSNPIENRQTEEQTQVATQQAEKPNNNRANTAIAAYQRVFSL
ncbi:MAG: hypothetical protein NT042_13950, partial [Sulfuritalea sp.]|nr:hypothetical protein [Sulfuritalea sp.]